MAGSDRVSVLVFPEPGATAVSYLDLMGSSRSRRPAPRLHLVTPERAAPRDLSGPLLVVGPAGAAITSYLATTPYPSSEVPASSEALRVASVNPWDPSSPMVLVTGGGAGAVRAALASGGLSRSFDYEVLRGGMRVRYGRFVAASGGKWRIDPANDTDLRARLGHAEQGPVRVVYVEGDRSVAEARLTALQVHDEMLGFVRKLGGEGSLPAVEVYLHPNLETKALRTSDPRPSHLMPASPGEPVRVHMAFPASATLASVGPDARLALARAAIRVVLGDIEPKGAAGGAAFLLAGGLMGRDPAWWQRRLSGSGASPAAADLMDDQAYSNHSYLVAMPASARLLQRVVENERGGSLGTILRDPELRRKMSRAQAAQEGAPRGPTAGSRPPIAITFQKGVSLAHEGYGVVDGYGSESAAVQMRRLRTLGAEWVALSPYAFMGDPHAGTIFFESSEEQSAGSENDHALLATIASAHGIGLKVMVKPQIWLSGGHWTGEVAMRTEKEWRAFFERYREFLAHYAILSAAGGADLLVVGVELQGTTAREVEWRQMISTARSLFDGPLTYAANWGREFETLAFWDALDYVGLDCYYPLSKDPKPTDEGLAQGARSAASHAEQVSRRTGRPVLLTEVGFPAIAGAWIAPHDEDTGRVPDPEAQARAYRALLAAFWERPWLAGLYWWKWPTSPPGSRPEAPFSPRGRPAEDVLAEWYGRDRPSSPDWPTTLP
ncbi:MAG TPA: hypothetical protein VGK94_04300 [Candidatus Polarisedimenticolia bacterium]|jgi:hypothetical protein